MRERRSHTEVIPEIVHHRQQNSRVQRTNESIANHEVLRLQVCNKQDSLRTIFTKSQKQLCDYFMKYSPMSYAHINLKKVVDESIDDIRLIKNSNKIYFGGVINGQRQGSGVLIDDKGKIYEGNFDGNQKCGHGIEIYPNGNLYIGNFDKGKKHGQGQFYWFNISPPVKEDAKYVEFYDGKWWGGLPDGQGSHQKSNGDIYDGQFKNGLKHGKGEQYFFIGDSYKGEYVNGLPQGQGIYLWNDISRYEGDFKQGLRSGQGIWISADERQEYRGSYLLDKKNGYGEYSWLDKVFLYKGNFQNDERQGYGELFKNGQQEYKGDWVNGKIKEKIQYDRNPHNVSTMSIRDSSMLKTPKSAKFPSLSRLRPPASAIIDRLKKNQSNHKKSNSRSRSPKLTSKSIDKLKNSLGLKSQKRLPLQKTLKKRPISVHLKTPFQHDSIPKYELLVRKCNRRNCGCNVSIPLAMRNKKGLSPSQRNLHQFHH